MMEKMIGQTMEQLLAMAPILIPLIGFVHSLANG
jgi:hypothetical protein